MRKFYLVSKEISGTRAEGTAKKDTPWVYKTRSRSRNTRIVIPATFARPNLAALWGSSGWVDSCFPGSWPTEASRSNKTIPYDLYLWAHCHLIAAAAALRSLSHREERATAGDLSSEAEDFESFGQRARNKSNAPTSGRACSEFATECGRLINWDLMMRLATEDPLIERAESPNTRLTVAILFMVFRDPFISPCSITRTFELTSRTLDGRNFTSRLINRLIDRFDEAICQGRSCTPKHGTYLGTIDSSAFDYLFI